MTNLDITLSDSWQTATADRGTRVRAFAAARRHSLRVRVLRILLPILGVATIAGFVIAARLAFPVNFDLEAARLSVTKNSIIMDRPHLTGFDRRHREYSLAANRAIQPLSNPRQVRLEAIEASVQAADGSVTTIKAETGDYDQSNSRLRLLGAITVDSAEGYVLRMTDAEVNFSDRTLVSENPVTIGYGESHISGKRLSVSDGGKLIVIDGDVRTTLLPPKNPPVANAPRPE